MSYSDLLLELKTFGKKNSYLIDDNSKIKELTEIWGNIISAQGKKQLIPLFITGTGISMSVGIMPINQIISDLDTQIRKHDNDSSVESVKKLLDEWNDLKIKKEFQIEALCQDF